MNSDLLLRSVSLGLVSVGKPSHGRTQKNSVKITEYRFQELPTDIKENMKRLNPVFTDFMVTQVAICYLIRR